LPIELQEQHAEVGIEVGTAVIAEVARAGIAVEGIADNLVELDTAGTAEYSVTGERAYPRLEHEPVKSLNHPRLYTRISKTFFPKHPSTLPHGVQLN